MIKSSRGLNASSSLAERIYELFNAIDVYVNGTTFTPEEHRQISEKLTYTKHNILGAQVREDV